MVKLYKVISFALLFLLLLSVIVVAEEYVPGRVLMKVDGLTKYSYVEHDTTDMIEHDDVVFSVFEKYGLVEMRHLMRDLVSKEGDKVTVQRSRERMMDVREKYPVRSARHELPEGYDPRMEDLYVLEFEEDAPIPEIINALKKSEYVVAATPDYLMAFDYIPDDLRINEGGQFSSEGWHLEKVNADQAWDITQGGSVNVTIAIIDSGVDYTHVDLGGCDPLDFAAGNCQKVIGGYDFYDNDYDPDHDYLRDVWYHGTKVAGMALAVGDNALGTAGLAYNTRLLAYRVGFNLSVDGSAALESVWNATNSGADVISMSYGRNNSQFADEIANLTYAYTQGVVLVAAAGNSNEMVPHYPAAYDNVIGVAATNITDERAPFSNYGTWVSVSAPGQNVLTTSPTNQYVNVSGTSYATPFVSGLAALILSENPTLTNDQVRYLIEMRADNIDAVNPSYTGLLGAGRINVYNSLNNDFGQWVEVSEGSASSEGIVSMDAGLVLIDPSIAIGRDNIVWIAYSNMDAITIPPRFHLEVSRFKDGQWSRFILSDNFPSLSAYPSVAVDSNNIPYVAWTELDADGDAEIYVKKYTGTGWVSVGTDSASGGGISDNTGSSLHPSLTIDNTGNPIVAWDDDTSGFNNIHIKQFDGNNWVGIAGSDTGGVSGSDSDSLNPVLSVDPSGDIIVLWEEFEGTNFEIYGKVYNGDSWVSIGGSSSTGGISSNLGDSYHPTIVIDIDDYPVVAWDDDTSGVPEIYVKKYNGVSWQPVSAGSASGGGISSSANNASRPSIAIDSLGNIVVVWENVMDYNVMDSTHTQIYTRSFDGVSWNEIDVGSASGEGVSKSSAVAKEPAVALDVYGTPVVVWEDNAYNNTYRIYTKTRLSLGQLGVAPVETSGAWVEMAGSASGGGVSGIGNTGYFPSVALMPDGNPIVAWSMLGSDESYTTNIYVEKFNGASWVEVGSGSAVGGGISNSFDASSSVPVILMGNDGNPIVVWDEEMPLGEGGSVYIKRFDGTDWVEMGNGSASGYGISEGIDLLNNWPSLSMTLKPDGNPIVSWWSLDGLYSSSNASIYVVEFDGENWVDLSAGIISNVEGIPSNMDIALDSDGTLYATWVSIDTGDNPDDDFSNGTILVKQFDGENWISVGGGLSCEGDWGCGGEDFFPQIIIDANGDPVVVWEEYYSDNLYARRFDGNDLVEVGSGSASGNGLSGTVLGSYEPSVTLAGGNIAVAWEQFLNDPAEEEYEDWDSEIFVKLFDGSSWVGVGGSGSGLGVSNNNRVSTSDDSSVIGDEGGNLVVAWTNSEYMDLGDADVSVYVKRYVAPEANAAIDGLVTVPQSTLQSFSAASSAASSSGSIQTYQWDFDYDGSVFTADVSGSVATADYTFDTQGTYTVAVRIIQDDGSFDVDTLTVTVVDPALTIVPVNFTNGFTLVGFPVDDVSITTIDDLLQRLGPECTTSYQWNGGSWTVHLASIPTLNDWVLNPTEGYWVYCNGLGGVLQTGFAGTVVATPVSVPIDTGFTLIGVPVAGYNASSFVSLAAGQGVDIDVMYSWDGTSYDIFVASANIGNFDLVPGHGYWAHSTNSGTVDVS